MKNTIRILPVIVMSFFLAFTVHAEKVHLKSGGSSTIKSTAAGCLPGANFKYLELNNVRTRINTGGDMWWDFETAQYEIPKGSKKMSMFSAALWIGGIDANGQLKLAAHRYRQVGIDFWPGPLTIDGTAAIDPETCAAYDKMYYITRPEVDDFNAWFDDPTTNPNYAIPASILNWPAHGDVSKGQSYFLAPFFDRDNDGVYDPTKGDYPYYDVSNELCHTKTPTAEGNGILVDQVIKGDATLWWVFNDKGNIHTETKGQPIGLEIRAQAFAFATNDQINDMTFYSYEIINRSTYRLTNTYFSQWVDTDLGYANDDYVGCDVMRGLGYCYNGTPKDGTGQIWAYGDQPPAIGVDFFQGPYLDPDGYDNPSFKPVYDASGKILQGPSYFSNCNIVLQDSTIQNLAYTVDSIGRPKDSMNVFVNAAAINGVNFGNGIVDDERFGMRRFVYHNNSNSGVPWYMTDPDIAPEYYSFLRGIWKDGTQMVYGANAHAAPGVTTGPPCYFMFPGESDICNWGTKGIAPDPSINNWTEVSAGNLPNDRRFMESAGPFTLEPGAVNYITVGIPWARASSGGPLASVKLLQSVDDKCQMLFDNCFKVISGPNAPDLTIRELDNELLIYITNRKANDAGNNFHEGYKELDPRIQPPPGEVWDPYYRFEGYQVYQLLNSDVTIADIKNNQLARLVFECDIKNNVSRIINFNYDLTLGASVPVEEVNGGNLGIKHSFSLTKDAFTGGDLINHIQYYYLAVAYAYNNYKTYIPTVGENLNGQQQPYLPGRKNIKVYTGIPHVPIGPVAPVSNYGDGVVITRIAGQGNGGNFLDLSDESVAEIMSKKPTDSVNVYGSTNYPIAYDLKYKLGKGPINVKVIDPLNVKDATYTVALDSMFNVRVPTGTFDTLMPTTRWKLIDSEGTVYKSDTTVDLQNEQMFINLGLSVSLNQTLYPGIYRTGQHYNSSTNKWVDDYSPVLPDNGVLGGSISYADSTSSWLRFLNDVDGGGSFNWIRSGTQIASAADPDARLNDWDAPDKPYDPDQNYEKLLGGTWAPYMLTASSAQDTAGPSFAKPIAKLSRNANFFTDLASVDVVFTSDKSKWTRCGVIEMCPYIGLGEGGAKEFDLRKHRSVNQDGDTNVVSSDPAMNSDYISAYGMGWFPGYAINIETGERLNIVFGEDSHLVNENGNDMLFNPTSTLINAEGKVVFGGKHYIYVMGHVYDKEKRVTLSPSLPINAADINSPAYDAGYHFVKEMNRTFTVAVYAQQLRAYLYSDVMWVSIPIANPNYTWLSTDITVKLRVTKPYARYFSAPMTGEFVSTHNANNFWPMYSFNTKGVATVQDSASKAVSDLDKINVVPNPYKGYAEYEVDQSDKRIKIVNLPQKCTVSIYSTGGALIRTFNKDESKTYIDWDLNNSAGIPIAGGVYIIHVKVPGVGDKVIKWFGALRQPDFNGF